MERKTFDEINVGETFFEYFDYYRAEPMVKLDSNRYVDKLGLITYLLQTDWHDIYVS